MTLACTIPEVRGWFHRCAEPLAVHALDEEVQSIRQNVDAFEQTGIREQSHYGNVALHVDALRPTEVGPVGQFLGSA